MAILKKIYPLLLIPLLTLYEDVFASDMHPTPVLCVNSLITAGEPIEAEISKSRLYTDSSDKSEVKHWEGSFLCGLNTDGYQFDFGIAYFPIHFVGIKANLGFTGEIEELGDWGKDELETHHHYTDRFKFTPSLVFRTPRLIHWKSQDAGFYIFAEPGIVLS